MYNRGILAEDGAALAVRNFKRKKRREFEERIMNQYNSVPTTSTSTSVTYNTTIINNGCSNNTVNINIEGDVETKINAKGEVTIINKSDGTRIHTDMYGNMTISNLSDEDYDD